VTGEPSAPEVIAVVLGALLALAGAAATVGWQRAGRAERARGGSQAAGETRREAAIRRAWRALVG
jgi:hypothetical protein